MEYLNKISRGISNLQCKITEIMNENPEFDIVEFGFRAVYGYFERKLVQ